MLKTKKAFSNKGVVMFAFAALLTITVTLLRFFSLLFEFDENIGYYKSTAILPTVFGIVCVLSIICFAIIALTAKRKLSGTSTQDKYAEFKFIAAAPFPIKFFAAIALLASIAESLLDLSLIYGDSFGLIFNSAMSITLKKYAIISAFVAALFFINGCRKGAGISSRLSPWLSLGVIANSVLSLAILYFDMEITMNSPIKIMTQVAFIVIACYIISESKFHLEAQLPYFHIFISLTAILILASSTFPEAFLRVYTHSYYGGAFIRNCLCPLAILIYISANTLAYMSHIFAKAEIPDCVDTAELDTIPESVDTEADDHTNDITGTLPSQIEDTDLTEETDSAEQDIACCESTIPCTSDDESGSDDLPDTECDIEQEKDVITETVDRQEPLPADDIAKSHESSLSSTPPSDTDLSDAGLPSPQLPDPTCDLNDSTLNNI